MAGGGSRVQVVLPRALLEYAGGAEAVETTGETLAEVLEGLEARFPGLRARIVDDQGRVRRFVHVFVNGSSSGFADPESVRLRPGDTVHILPSVAGGNGGGNS